MLEHDIEYPGKATQRRLPILFTREAISKPIIIVLVIIAIAIVAAVVVFIGISAGGFLYF